MYQINYTSGYQLVVIGTGTNGLARITRNGLTVREDGYQACAEWLQDRGITVPGSNSVTKIDNAIADVIQGRKFVATSKG